MNNAKYQCDGCKTEIKFLLRSVVDQLIASWVELKDGAPVKISADCEVCGNRQTFTFGEWVN